LEETVMPFDASLSERLPTAEEVEQTKKAVGALAHRTDRTGVPSLRLKHDRSSGYVELPPAVGQLVLQVAEGGCGTLHSVTSSNV